MHLCFSEVVLVSLSALLYFPPLFSVLLFPGPYAWAALCVLTGSASWQAQSLQAAAGQSCERFDDRKENRCRGEDWKQHVRFRQVYAHHLCKVKTLLISFPRNDQQRNVKTPLVTDLAQKHVSIIKVRLIWEINKNKSFDSSGRNQWA